MDNKIVLLSYSVEELQSIIANVIKTELENFRLQELNKLQPENEEYLTANKAAKMLGISLPTLHKYKKNGSLPASWLGHLLRFKKSEVEKALKQRLHKGGH